MRIIVDQVGKSFEKKPVLTDISFAAGSGDIVCLLGPSGSGKTTLIRLLIGAIAADSGVIRYDDVSIPDMSLMPKIGFMPQNDALYDDLTGESNLRFFGGLYKMRKSPLNKRIRDTLDLVGLSEDGKKLVRNYSGGMKKRLSLAVALLHEPDILLLDEPTVGIDPILRRAVWNRFQLLKRQGKIIIVSTHVMDEVQKCDKAALIYNGRFIYFDTVERLLNQTENGRIEELFFLAAASDKNEGSMPL